MTKTLSTEQIADLAGVSPQDVQRDLRHGILVSQEAVSVRVWLLGLLRSQLESQIKKELLAESDKPLLRRKRW